MTDVWGGGIVIAMAAVLWLVYLTPSWRRRRDYLATERNAVRLQQTLRILAETAELPEEVRLEAKVRVVAEQEKALRKARKHEAAKAKADAEAEAARSELDAVQARRAADRLIAAARVESTVAAPLAVRSAAPPVTEPAAPPVTGLSPRAAAYSRAGAMRRRRLRAMLSLVLLLALVAAVVGTAIGVSAGEWLPLLVAVVVGSSCVAMLVRLAKPLPSRVPQPVRHPRPVAAELYDHAVADGSADAASTWTPRPLPKPLHLEPGTAAAGAMASVDAAARLRRAAALAALEEKAAERTPRPASIRPAAPAPSIRPAAQETRSAAPAETRGFARMGIVEEDSGTAALDLDAVMRRRRAG